MSLAFEVTLQRGNFQLAIASTLPGRGFSGLFGASGAGKTTLLRCLAGLETDARGSVTLGQTQYPLSARDWPVEHRELAYVFQDARLFPHLTVRQNLLYAWRRRCNDHGPDLTEVSSAFAINDLLERPATAISAGQAQRVAMARAFLRSPRWILMDEPLASLDQRSRALILGQLEALQQSLDCPVLYVSHHSEEIARLCDQALVIDNGQLLAQDSVFHLFARTDLPFSHGEAAHSVLQATVHGHDDDYRLSELRLNGQGSLWVSRLSLPAGHRLRVSIPARDVSVTLSQAGDSSILNCLATVIDRMEEEGPASVLLRLRLGEQYLLARVTRKSAARLQLRTGLQVYAQIKSVALMHDLQLQGAEGEAPQ